MDFTNALKAVAPYAGIAGVGLVVLYYLFRDFINKKIFPQLPAAKAYRLLRLFLILTFVAAALAMLTGVAFRTMEARATTQAEERKLEDKKQAAILKRQADEEAAQLAMRKAWEDERRAQIGALEKQRESIQQSLEQLQKEMAAQQASAAQEEVERASVAETQAQTSAKAAEEQQARLREEEMAKLEKLRDEQREAEKEAKENIARACCDPFTGQKVCRVASRLKMELGDTCFCAGIPGSGIGCR